MHDEAQYERRNLEKYQSEIRAAKSELTREKDKLSVTRVSPIIRWRQITYMEYLNIIHKFQIIHKIFKQKKIAKFPGRFEKIGRVQPTGFEDRQGKGRAGASSSRAQKIRRRPQEI